MGNFQILFKLNSALSFSLRYGVHLALSPRVLHMSLSLGYFGLKNGLQLQEAWKAGYNLCILLSQILLTVRRYYYRSTEHMMYIHHH
jgi:hypothetical protein